jgi:ubiquinol oxidase
MRFYSAHAAKKEYSEEELADHSWRQTNHIWSAAEIKERMLTKDQKHKPKTVSDHIMATIMKTMYHSFNFITGYKEVDPSPKSIEWRLIILESVAGVPGFVGAGFRHFHSLRTLQRDHGMIFTLLEEAENERMHLLTCLKMFEASFVTRFLVVTAQMALTPFLMVLYTVHPGSMHRFVGYLEETAVHTYANIVHHTETEGMQLHTAWAALQAPEIAVSYWQLPVGERMWVDTLKRMLADESHHRDVNHSLGSLPPNSANPFIHEHMADFDHAVVRRIERRLKDAAARL